MMKPNFEAFFRDLGKNVKGGAETVRDYAKVKYSLSRENGEIDQLIKELGKLAYESYLKGEDIPEKEFKLLCSAIDEGYSAVGDLKKEELRILGKEECPNCGKGLDKAYEFCPFCGAAIARGEDEKDEKEEAAQPCDCGCDPSCCGEDGGDCCCCDCCEEEPESSEPSDNA